MPTQNAPCDESHRSSESANLTAALESLENLDPTLEALVTTLVETIDDLQTRISDLEDKLERTHDIATTASAKSETNASRIDDLEDDQEHTHDVATTAVAKAQQLESETEDPEPDGIEASSSPLDFFANCRESTVRELFVEDANRQNTYRAISVAKRWPEFASERTDGEAIFWTRDDLRTALTAELGRSPHAQTVTRVWEQLAELGGDDVRQRSHSVGRRQDSKELLELDRANAEGLLEKRYLGLELLEDCGRSAPVHGVTPVVTREAT